MYCIKERPQGVKEIKTKKVFGVEHLEVEMEDGTIVSIEPRATTVYSEANKLGTRVPHHPK